MRGKRACSQQVQSALGCCSHWEQMSRGSFVGKFRSVPKGLSWAYYSSHVAALCSFHRVCLGSHTLSHLSKCIDIMYFAAVDRTHFG